MKSILKAIKDWIGPNYSESEHQPVENKPAGVAPIQSTNKIVVKPRPLEEKMNRIFKKYPEINDSFFILDSSCGDWIGEKVKVTKIEHFVEK